MPVQIFTDVDGRRVIVRNVGAPGKGIPAGGTASQILSKVNGTDYATVWVNAPAGTGAAVGPASSVSGNLVTFNGTTGKLLSDSGVALAALATTTNLALKEDKVAGKGLSANDFTTVLKTKLDLQSPGVFRGKFTTLGAITSLTNPVEGNRANLEVVGSVVVQYLFDSTNNVWTPQSFAPVSMTGQQIATLLYDGSQVWSKLNSLIFTSDYKTLVDSHESTISLLTGGVGTYQPADPTLTAFAAVVNSADKLAYFSATDAFTTIPFLAAGRNLVSAATLDAQKTLLGIGLSDPSITGVTGTPISRIRHGIATLVAGVVTVADVNVTALTRIFLTPQDNLTVGAVRVSGRVAATSFTITSSNGADTGVVAYQMIEP